MYRIRLGSGEEAVYRTAEEMALAVRSGVLSPTAEVFHKSADRWLPIDVHPDYRAVVTGKRPALPDTQPGGRRNSASHRQPDAALTDPDPSTIAPEPSPPAPTPEPAPIAPAAEAAYDPATDPTPVFTTAGTGSGVSRARKLRVMLALATGIGVLALAGTATVLAGPRILAGLRSVRLPARTVEAGMPPEVTRAAQATDSLAVPDVAMDPWPELAPAPETRVSRLPGGRPTPPTYLEAYADARAEMDEGFEYIRFSQVFDPSRFGTPDSLRAARRMTAAATNILRLYRGKEVQLEQTYRPSDPGGRGTLREPFEVAEDARELLGDVDSLFGLLVAQQGRFAYRDGALRFAEPQTARRYADLRQQIIGTLNRWRASPGLAAGTTLPRLVRAIGTQPPPPVR